MLVDQNLLLENPLNQIRIKEGCEKEKSTLLNSSYFRSRGQSVTRRYSLTVVGGGGISYVNLYILEDSNGYM